MTATANRGKKAKSPVMAESDALTDLGELEEELDASSAKSKAKKGKSPAKKTAKTEGDKDHLDTDCSADKPVKKRKRILKKDQTHLPPNSTYPARHWESKKFIGAHVSIAEGAHYAPHRALMLGGKAFGMFTKTQKAWTAKPLTEASLRLFPMRCVGKTETEPDCDGEVKEIGLGDERGFDMAKHIVPQ